MLVKRYAKNNGLVFPIVLNPELIGIVKNEVVLKKTLKQEYWEKIKNSINSI